MTTKQQAGKTVWSKHAANWQRVGAPLRPSEEDGRLMLDLVGPVLSECHDEANVIVMGVTPEVVQLPWPSYVSLQAYDHSAEMIESVWCSNPKIRSSVKQIAWQSMPLPNNSVDAVVGDGCVNVLADSDDYKAVFTEISRVLKDSGRLVLRCFIRPDTSETLEEVATAALNGRIESFHALKWRVAMALDVREDFTVAVSDIHDAFNRLFPDRTRLASQAGWLRDTIDTIDAYQGVETRYTFPTLAELTRLSAPFFDVSDVRYGQYELANRCPTVCFKPKPRTQEVAEYPQSSHAAITVIGQAVAIPGFIYGLHYPSLMAVISIPTSKTRDWLSRINTCLGDLIFEPYNKHANVQSDNAGGLIEAMLHWIYQMQQSVGLPVSEQGRIVDHHLSSGRIVIAMPSTAQGHQAIGSALNWILKIFNALTTEKVPDALRAELPEVLLRLKELVSTRSNIPRFLRAAYPLGIPFTELPGQVFQFGNGARARWLDSSFTDETTVIAAKFARNKAMAAAILRQSGIPVPDHVLVNSVDAALRAAESIGYPVVVKPVDLEGGIGVATGLMTPNEVVEAFKRAQQHTLSVLVEKHFEGRDYRLTVFNGELISAIERVPGGVTGDGESTVEALVDRLNEDPRRGEGAHAPLKRLKLDEEARALLNRIGLKEESIPPAGQYVRLRRAANVAAGGMPVAVTDQVHPDNRLLAIRAGAALRLDLSGVDLLIPDITRSWKEAGAAVCEVNAQPYLGQITSAHLYGSILHQLVEGNGCIPVAVIVGASPDSTLVTEICKSLDTAGLRSGRSDHEGVTVGYERIVDGPVGVYAGGRILMMDQGVNAAVVCTNDTDVLQSGLPFARFDVLVLAGLNITVSAGQEKLSQERAFQHVLKAVLPACHGKVFTVEGAGLEVYMPIKNSDKETWTSTSIEEHGLAEAVVSEMIEANEKHRSAGTIEHA